MEETFQYILYVAFSIVMAFVGAGATYFFQTRKERKKEKQQNDQLIEDMKYIRDKFDLVEACQRDTSIISLIETTKDLQKQGWIPMHIKTLLLNICDTLHKQGADGDVSQCEIVINELEGK